MYYRANDEIYEGIENQVYDDIKEVKLRNGLVGYLDEYDIVSRGNNIKDLCDIFVITTYNLDTYGISPNQSSSMKILETFSNYEDFITSYISIKSIDTSVKGYGCIRSKGRALLRALLKCGYNRSLDSNNLRLVLIR